MFGIFSSTKERMGDICTKIVAMTDDGVVAIDHNHVIILFNQGAERIFGYRADDVIGKPLNLLIPERFHLQHNLLVDDFGKGPVDTRPGEDRARQTYGLRRDGSEFLAQIAIMRVSDSKGAVYAAVVRDISENKKTEEELLRLAATDPLTGAFNRREFTALCEREALRSHRYHRPLSILILDLDHFKRLNDTYGHAAGDKALQRFTTLCCNALRNVDIFGRWGGEEFVALLPETDLNGAAIIAERLRKMVNDTILDYNEHKITFTVSIGVAQYRDDEVSIEGPLARADSAVYDAKKSGRNQIAVYRD